MLTISELSKNNQEAYKSAFRGVSSRLVSIVVSPNVLIIEVI